MMKLLGKVLSFILGALFALSTNVSAMTFSQPVEMGEALLATTDYYEIEGATSHTGQPFTNKKFIAAYPPLQKFNGTKFFDKGVARFAIGNNEIYFHYDAKNGYYHTYKPESRFGGKNINNTVETWSGRIYFVDTDTDTKLYLIQHIGGEVGAGHELIGKRADGAYVKYFNTREIKDKFLGRGRRYYVDDHITLKDDVVIVPFYDTEVGSVVKNGKYHHNPIGEFRFKWDDAAQWFGVEQVVY